MKEQPNSTLLTCANGDCQLTASDRTQITSWKAEYDQWQKNPSSWNFRRDLIGPLSFLIVSLPLFIIFFILMERGARVERQKYTKPTSIRSLYHYFISFSGLLMAVIGLGLIVNSGLQVWLKSESSSTSQPVMVSDDTGVRSFLACNTACGYTDADATLANNWLSDYQAYQKGTTSTEGRFQNDLANSLPVILVGLPLFWYHFVKIRRESAEKNQPTTPTATT
jgi:hypothetical protein